jgi:hypothetical protein
MEQDAILAGETDLPAAIADVSKSLDYLHGLS